MAANIPGLHALACASLQDMRSECSTQWDIGSGVESRQGIYMLLPEVFIFECVHWLWSHLEAQENGKGFAFEWIKATGRGLKLSLSEQA